MNSALMHSQPESMLESFENIGDVPLELSAELDRRTISFQDLMDLRPGSLLTLSRPTGENIDLYAGEVLIGSGEILVIDGVMSVRIADLLDRPLTVTIDETTAAKAEVGALVDGSQGQGSLT
jgi:flagellar motor switch/type III secretory pathway protein FliN